MRKKPNIKKKLKDLYDEQASLMKHRSRSNQADLLSQRRYTKKLDKLFDISSVAADKLIKNEKNRLFVKLQYESRTGSIEPVDKNLAERKKNLM